MFDISKPDKNKYTGGMSQPTTKMVAGLLGGPAKREALKEARTLAKETQGSSIGDMIFSNIKRSEHAISRKKVGLSPTFDTKRYQNLVQSGENRPTRNRNPLNIKASDYTRKYPGVAGVDPVPATDGGQFLVFNSVRDGFNAAERLLSTSGYTSLTVDAAMKRWSNSGYGGEILPAISKKLVARLTPGEKRLLVEAMARREGFNV